MSNGRFSHNLNMEIAGPLLAQIGKSILVVSHLFSASCCWFSTKPSHYRRVQTITTGLNWSTNMLFNSLMSLYCQLRADASPAHKGSTRAYPTTAGRRIMWGRVLEEGGVNEG